MIVLLVLMCVVQVQELKSFDMATKRREAVVSDSQGRRFSLAKVRLRFSRIGLESNTKTGSHQFDHRADRCHERA
jgi:hypothetical protein